MRRTVLPALAALLLSSGCSGLLDLPAARMQAPTDSGLDAAPDAGPPLPDAAVEQCNGLDDDRDDEVDEDFECAACSTVPCTTSCGDPGLRQCTDACTTDGPCVSLAAEDCDRPGDQNCAVARDQDDPCCSRPHNYRCADAEALPPLGGEADGCTQQARDEVQDPSLASAGPDVVYRLPLEARSTVRISLDGSAFDTVLYVRSDCEDPLTTQGFDDDAYTDCRAGGRASLLEIVLDPGDWFIVVDSPSVDELGPYHLAVDVTPL